MIRNRNFIVLLFLLILMGSTIKGHAQQTKYSETQIESYKEKAKDQIRFLAYMLNTLGNSQTSPRDKDVIIRESYKKIFRDEKVQIEDDLSENRKVITNKDVTAYLKDIEFFFEQVKFEFDIKNIEAFTRENGELSFKISLNRTMKATGLEGEVILNTKPRFIEINLNKRTDELAIASIYTTKVSRDVALQEWWKSISFGWKSIFREKLAFSSDSVTLPMLYKIVSLDSIDLSGNMVIVSLEPLNMLVDLKHIDISKTRIDDISAMSSLNGLVSLNLSNTTISDISYLRYAENMKHLNLSYTRVASLEPLINLHQLESLSIAGSNINEFTILKFFTQLQQLDLAETNFGQLSILESLTNLKALNLSRTNIFSFSHQVSPNSLENLDLSFTSIKNISPLAGYTSLNTINISNTQVADLTGLMGINSLEKIYADNTLLTEATVTDFKDNRPNVIVVFNSEELSAWWLALSTNWQDGLKTYIQNSKSQIPTKEQLAKLVSIDSLDLSGKGLTDIKPLKKFVRLRILDISNNSVVNFDELQYLSSLTKLKARNTGFKETSSVLGLNKLQNIDISNNSLTTDQILKLTQLKNIKLLNIDETGTKKQTVGQFRELTVSDCIVIFDTDGLMSWWNGLDNTWQQIFKLQVNISTVPTSKELHRLISLNKILIVDEPVLDLYPLEKFIQLESIYLEKTKLTSLESVKTLGAIKNLTVKFSAISSLEPLSQLNSLVALNLNNTAVEDLKPLKNLTNLQQLYVAGTKVSDLKGLEEMYSLQTLDISSTQIKRLKYLNELINLERLVCFNTRITNREIEKFEGYHPRCEVMHY